MPSSNNRLLASLSTNDFDLLGPHLECVTLGSGPIKVLALGRITDL